MKVYGKVALAAVSLSLMTAPAAAQSWKWDWGINGGYSWLSKVLDQDQTGLDETSGANTLHFASGFLVGTQLTMWPSQKLGLRANLRYTSRDLKGDDMGDASSTDFVENIHLWGGTGDILLRFKAPAAEYTGMEMLPYLALGAGMKWVNPAGDRYTCNDPTEGQSWSCGPFQTGLPAAPPTAKGWAVGEQPVLLGHVGLGADWRIGRTLALRTEISDQFFRPQFHQYDCGASCNSSTLTSDNLTLSDGDDNEANYVHEIGAQIGLHFLFGVPRPVVVAVVTAPVAPTPEPVRPTPTPTPQPQPPRVDNITVCVIDPSAPGGIRMQAASYRYEQRDTVVMSNGQQIALRNAIGNIQVASNADWYVRGSALEMSVGSEKVQFVTTGTPTMVESSNLAYLGTINGLAIYADRGDVADVRDELAELNRAQRGTDLGRILAEHKDLNEALSDVKVFYVPLQPTGCVFQAVSMQQPVRKGKQ